MCRYIDRLYGVYIYTWYNLFWMVGMGWDGKGCGMWDGQYINYIGDDGSWNVMKLYFVMYMYAFIFTSINWMKGHVCINKPWFSPKNHGCLPETHGFFQVFPCFSRFFPNHRVLSHMASTMAASRTARWWRRRSSARCCRCSRSPAAMRRLASWMAKRCSRF